MLQEAVEEYISALTYKERKHGQRSFHTCMAYRNDLGQFYHYLTDLGISQWSQVSRELIATYLLHLREGTAYRPSTVARKLAALKSFFRYLYEHQYINDNPTSTLEAPRIQKGPPQVLQPEQVHRLFEQVDTSTPTGTRDFAMLHTLYCTGMRASEVVALDLSDFHAKNATIDCHTGSETYERVLPLSIAALEALQYYLAYGRHRLLRSAPKHEPAALFLNHRGERLTRQGFWLIVKNYARKASITSLTPHMLRHSFAILMLKGGMDLGTVQTLLGHAHSTTTQIYMHLVSEQKPASNKGTDDLDPTL